jgi:hypothetical protein
MESLASELLYSRQTTRLSVDPRAQEIVNNDELWRALKKELRDSRAMTNQAISAISQDFMAWHFEEGTAVATRDAMKRQERRSSTRSTSSTWSLRSVGDQDNDSKPPLLLGLLDTFTNTNNTEKPAFTLMLSTFESIKQCVVCDELKPVPEIELQYRKSPQGILSSSARQRPVSFRNNHVGARCA